MSEFLSQVHGNLSGIHHRALTGFRIHVRNLQVVVLGDDLLNIFHRHGNRTHIKDVTQGDFGGFNGYWKIVEIRVGQNLLNGTFEFAYVAIKPFGNDDGNFFRHFKPGSVGFL